MQSLRAIPGPQTPFDPETRISRRPDRSRIWPKLQTEQCVRIYSGRRTMAMEQVVPIAAKLALKGHAGFWISNNPIKTAVPDGSGRIDMGQPLSGTIRAWSSTTRCCAAADMSAIPNLAAMIARSRRGKVPVRYAEVLGILAEQRRTSPRRSIHTIHILPVLGGPFRSRPRRPAPIVDLIPRQLGEGLCRQRQRGDYRLSGRLAELGRRMREGALPVAANQASVVQTLLAMAPARHGSHVNVIEAYDQLEAGAGRPPRRANWWFFKRRRPVAQKFEWV